jgi:hypothetical protein
MCRGNLHQGILSTTVNASHMTQGRAGYESTIPEVRMRGWIYGRLHWTYLTQDWIQKWAYMNLVKKLCVPQLRDKIFKYLDKRMTDQYLIHK